MSNKHYTCELCKKEFNQKIDFTRHQNKKAPCITLTEMQQICQTKEVKMEFKTNLSTIFNYCLDVLRNNEYLTGDKALRTLAHLLDLRLLEPQFGNQIDIDTYEYDFSSYEDEIIEKHKAKLLSMVRFSNLAKEKEENIPKIMKCLWDEILSVHPITKNVFLEGKGFDIQHQSTYKKIIDKLYTFDFEAIDEDILGEAYEEVIKDVMTGKVLGQFFTPPKIKQMMIKLIDPQLKTDGTIEKIFDPAMGTGGFLISSLRHLLQQSKTKGIKMNWDFISNEGLGGRETEQDTYQLAISNMLISSGHMFNVLEKGNSIHNPITNKYDIILANPPFGIDGLIYEEILHSLRNEYMPIKSNSAVPLFLQAIIYMLKINGRCAVVLPDGKDLFNKSTNTLVAIREYLLKTCDLKEIIYLPSGIFIYTSIKTCVFYFVKKREGSDVLETTIKYSKVNQKETGRDYKFSKTHQTTKVKFYDFNPYEDVKNLLVEVPIEKLASNSYSLNYAEYMKDESEEEHYEEGVVVKSLGEVCKFLPKSKRNAKYGKDEGLYPFIKSSMIVKKYVDEPDYEEESLIIGDGGEPNINYGLKFSTSNHCYILQNKNKTILNLKYSYYYLFHNLDMMDKLYTGVAIKNISKTNIENIKIPIPSLEKQQEIVKYLDFIYEKANKTSQAKIKELKGLNEFCLNTQKMFGDNVVKTLGEVCEFIKTGKNKPSDNKTGTLYPYYGTGSITGYTDEYLFDGYYILTARNGTIGTCFLTEGKIFPSDHLFVIDIKDKCLMKYVYYILSNNDKLDKLKTGVGIPNITKGTLETLKFPIPSLEKQKEIVEYCEYNNTLIKQLEKEIENNKKQAQLFITSIVKTQVKEQDDIISLNTEPTNEVQNEIVYVEDDVVIEPKPKTKIIIKKKVKKPLKIIEV
jgi:type I restriction enzyme M protein